jgi:CRP/FNR family transcriptional regulator
VVKSTATGREMLLYRVEPGGRASSRSSCLLARSPYSARGVAETPLSLLLLPTAMFERLIDDNRAFRDFVFHLFAERIAELMQLVEEVAFQRLDQRLAKLLLAKAGVIHATHQASGRRTRQRARDCQPLAQGLRRAGTGHARREQITVIDRTGLQQVAEINR